VYEENVQIVACEFLKSTPPVNQRFTIVLIEISGKQFERGEKYGN
jgi:hypothetical protein